MTVLTALSLVALTLLSSPAMDRGLAHSQWPMFHQNAQHTGLSPFPGPNGPSLRWKFQTGGPVDSSPAVGHGRIYVTSEDGNLYALNMQGHLLWKFQTLCHYFEFGTVTPAIGSDGTVYLAGHICSGERQKGILYAINPGGKQKWNFTNQNPGEGVDSFTSPTIGPDGTIYVSDVGFRIFAFNPDGTVKWQLATQGEVVGPPALAPDGTVYVAVDDPPPTGSCQEALNKCLVALNPDGTIKWALFDGALFDGGFDSAAIGSDSTVYIDSSAVNPEGTVKWNNPGTFGSPSIGPYGTIYGSVREGNTLHALNPDGTLRWQFPIERPSGSGGPCCFYGIVGLSSVAIGSNGILYFGVGVEGFCDCGPAPSGYGNASLYAVAPNGTLAWKFVIHPTVTCATFLCAIVSVSDPAIGSDGTIYFGSGDGNLYAIGSASQSDCNGSWEINE